MTRKPVAVCGQRVVDFVEPTERLRRDAEFVVEDKHEHQRDEEGREGGADADDDAAQMIDPRTLPHRREHAERQTNRRPRRQVRPTSTQRRPEGAPQDRRARSVPTRSSVRDRRGRASTHSRRIARSAACRDRVARGSAQCSPASPKSPRNRPPGRPAARAPAGTSTTTTPTRLGRAVSTAFHGLRDGATSVFIRALGVADHSLLTKR